MSWSERPHPEARSVGLGRHAEALTGRGISLFRDDGRSATPGAHRPARGVARSGSSSQMVAERSELSTLLNPLCASSLAECIAAHQNDCLRRHR